MGELGLISPTYYATLTRIFIFFWVGPPIIHKLQAGGPAHNLQAASCQENYFYFYVELILDLGYSGLLTKGEIQWD